MNSEFLDFFREPTKAHFITARNFVITHPNYSPYSDDLSQIENLLDASNFEAVMNYHNVNTILCPRAHMYKKYAATQLNNEKDAETEFFLAHRILEGIETTGDGSKENPYFVLRVSDERDFLQYLGETFKAQSLVKDERIYDQILTESGKTIYFDITECYQMIASYDMNDMLSSLGVDLSEEDDDADNNNETKKKPQRSTPKTNSKKWWKFW